MDNSTNSVILGFLKGAGAVLVVVILLIIFSPAAPAFGIAYFLYVLAGLLGSNNEFFKALSDLLSGR